MTRLVAAAAAPAAAPVADADAIVTDCIQVVVDRLRDRLGIPESVYVSIKPQVALIVSVEAPVDQDAMRVVTRDSLVGVYHKL